MRRRGDFSTRRGHRASAWTPNSVRLLLLSGIGEKYDPVTAKGTLGKNLTHQVTSGASGMLVFKERLNLFMGSGAVGYGISDLDGDVKQEVPEKICVEAPSCEVRQRGRAQPVRSDGYREVQPRATGVRPGRRLRIEHWDRIGPGVEMRGEPLCLPAELHGSRSHVIPTSGVILF